MKKILSFLFLSVLVFSCAKIPVQSLQLADAIADEGARMHDLNVRLLDQMFREKKAALDSFMRNQYTPAFVENIKRLIPPGTNASDALGPILQRAVPMISQRRDSLANALEDQRMKLSAQLQADYQVFQQAITELRGLLESAVKLDNEKKGLYQTAKKLSGNRIDFSSVEDAIDRFIIAGGTVGGNVADNAQKLNEYINRLLKK